MEHEEIIETLWQYKALLDNGTLSPAEFEEKKQQLLAQPVSGNSLSGREVFSALIHKITGVKKSVFFAVLGAVALVICAVFFLSTIKAPYEKQAEKLYALRMQQLISAGCTDSAVKAANEYTDRYAVSLKINRLKRKAKRTKVETKAPEQKEDPTAPEQEKVMDEDTAAREFAAMVRLYQKWYCESSYLNGLVAINLEEPMTVDTFGTAYKVEDPVIRMRADLDAVFGQYCTSGVYKQLSDVEFTLEDIDKALCYSPSSNGYSNLEITEPDMKKKSDTEYHFTAVFKRTVTGGVEVTESEWVYQKQADGKWLFTEVTFGEPSFERDPNAAPEQNTSIFGDSLESLINEGLDILGGAVSSILGGFR